MEKEFKVGKIVKTDTNKKGKKIIVINDGKEEFTPIFSPNNYPEVGEVITRCKVGDIVTFDSKTQLTPNNKKIVWLNYLEIKESCQKEEKPISNLNERNNPVSNSISFNEQLTTSIKIIELYYKIKKNEEPLSLENLRNEILQVNEKIFGDKE